MSARLSLHVRMHFKEYYLRKRNPINYEKAVHKLFATASRWKTLDITYENPPFEGLTNILNLRFPILEEARITSSHNTDPYFISAYFSAPSLRKLHLYKVDLMWDIEDYPLPETLEELAIIDQQHLFLTPIFDWAAILKATPNLRKLVLQGAYTLFADGEEDWGAVEDFALPFEKLETLVIRDTHLLHAARILAIIQGQNLKSLWLGLQIFDGDHSEEDMTEDLDELCGHVWVTPRFPNLQTLSINPTISRLGMTLKPFLLSMPTTLQEFNITDMFDIAKSPPAIHLSRLVELLLDATIPERFREIGTMSRA